MLDARPRAEPRRGRVTVVGVVAGTGAQAVIDVDRVHVETVLAREREQRERVGAAAAPDDDARVRARDRRARRERFTPVRRRRARARAAGSLSSATVGRFSGACHTASNAGRPADLVDAAHEVFADLVLPHLLLDAEQLVHRAGDAADLAPLREHPRHALLAGDVLATEVVHHDVAVAFEHRHQRLHLPEHAALRGRREQSDETAFVERVAPGAHLVDRAR